MGVLQMHGSALVCRGHTRTSSSPSGRYSPYSVHHTLDSLPRRHSDTVIDGRATPLPPFSDVVNGNYTSDFKPTLPPLRFLGQDNSVQAEYQPPDDQHYPLRTLTSLSALGPQLSTGRPTHCPTNMLPSTSDYSPSTWASSPWETEDVNLSPGPIPSIEDSTAQVEHKRLHKEQQQTRRDETKDMSCYLEENLIDYLGFDSVFKQSGTTKGSNRKNSGLINQKPAIQRALGETLAASYHFLGIFGIQDSQMKAFHKKLNLFKRDLCCQARCEPRGRGDCELSAKEIEEFPRLRDEGVPHLWCAEVTLFKKYLPGFLDDFLLEACEENGDTAALKFIRSRRSPVVPPSPHFKARL